MKAAHFTTCFMLSMLLGSMVYGITQEEVAEKWTLDTASLKDLPIVVAYRQKSSRFVTKEDTVGKPVDGDILTSQPRIHSGDGRTTSPSRKVVAFNAGVGLAREDADSTYAVSYYGEKVRIERFQESDIEVDFGKHLTARSHLVILYDGMDTKLFEEVRNPKSGKTERFGVWMKNTKCVRLSAFNPFAWRPEFRAGDALEAETTGSGLVSLVRRGTEGGVERSFDVDERAGFFLRGFWAKNSDGGSMECRWTGPKRIGALNLPTSEMTQVVGADGKPAKRISRTEMEYNTLGPSEADAAFRFEFPEDTKFNTPSAMSCLRSFVMLCR